LLILFFNAQLIERQGFASLSFWFPLVDAAALTTAIDRTLQHNYLNQNKMFNNFIKLFFIK